MSQSEKYELFKSLHIKGDPLVLCNIWDEGSARSVEEGGAKSIATSSWSVAASHGYSDGEHIPFHLLLENVKRIVSSVALPVSIDLESGYGRTSAEVQEHIEKISAVGAIGINFEDQIIEHPGTLYSIEMQCLRIEAAHRATRHMPIFINARTDLFLQSDPAQHDQMMEDAILRATAYAAAGADCFFVPGLSNTGLIRTLCEKLPIPVNIMTSFSGLAVKQLAALGVARVSYGPAPYFRVMDALKEACQVAMGS